VLRNHDHPGACVRSDELSEMPRHRLRVVSDQDSSLPRSDFQYLKVVETLQARHGGRTKIDLRRSAQAGGNDDLIEIGVRLEADLHQEGVWMVRRAAASFS